MDFRVHLRNLVIGASLTDWLLVFFTGALTIVGILQWREMHSGGRDTHDLAVQAKAQAEAAKAQADAAKAQSDIASQTFRLAFQPNLRVLEPTLLQTTPSDAVVYRIENSGTGIASAVTLDIEAMINGKVAAHRNVAQQQLLPGEVIPGRLDIGRALLMPVWNGQQRLILKVQGRFDGRPAGRTIICSSFTYDPAVARYAPDTGC